MRLLHCLLIVAVLCRGLVPVGYMPAPVGQGGGLVLCPGAGPQLSLHPQPHLSRAGAGAPPAMSMPTMAMPASAGASHAPAALSLPTATPHEHITLVSAALPDQASHTPHAPTHGADEPHKTPHTAPCPFAVNAHGAPSVAPPALVALLPTRAAPASFPPQRHPALAVLSKTAPPRAPPLFA